MRFAAAGILLALTVALVLIAIGALQNAWASKPDGPRWVYALAAVVALAVASLPAVVAWRLARSGDGPRRR